MKKGLFTLLIVFVALFVADMSAQTSRKAKVPVQKDVAFESLRWTQRRPLSLINCFKTSMPFKVSQKGALGRFFAKSVGDGTMINGNVIAANNWTEDNLHYGVYSFNAKGDFTIDPIIEKAELNSPMAVYAKGKYYFGGCCLKFLVLYLIPKRGKEKMYLLTRRYGIIFRYLLRWLMMRQPTMCML